jgi:hypothetical protein
VVKSCKEKGGVNLSLSVSFPTEIESVLRQRAAALGKDVDTFVREIVIEEVADMPAIENCAVSHTEFMERLDAMIQRHGIRNGNFDDSRESIYSGRGE